MAATARAVEEAEKKPDDEPVIGGVRALLYVAIQAALSEGFAEEVVFEHEQISPEAWQQADEAWAAALADSVEKDSKLFDNYDATFNAYKWAFHRKIEPLESDLDAWMNFSAHLNDSEDQKAFLADLAIDQNDVIRLQQIWAARLGEDAALRERMAERMGKEPGEMPKLDVPEKKLPDPVNDRPISVPEEPEEAPAEKRKPPPPPLLAALPVFAKASSAAQGGAAPGAASPSSKPPAAAAPTPPREEFGFYVPPPERVAPRPISAPPPIRPAASIPPPALVPRAAPAPATNWQGGPALNLGDYTAALGEMLAFPGSEARVASKYGLSLETFARERVAWDNQLAAAPALKAEYTDRLERAISHWQALARRR